jgi:polyhydroxybutyrate depolymerase
VAAIAAFGANMPTEDNFACEVKKAPLSVLLVNGTDDRINPFAGGKVSVFGFASRGTVLSSQATAELFAQRAGIAGFHHWQEAQGNVERWRWFEPTRADVELVAVHGGGHVIPGPSSAFPRILGNVSRMFDGPRAAWQFFLRQMSGRGGARSSETTLR